MCFGTLSCCREGPGVRLHVLPDENLRNEEWKKYIPVAGIL